MKDKDYIDEYGEVGDLSDVKLPPQAKGKLEYHSTPNKDKELEEQIAKAYGGCTKCYGKGYATWRHGESYRSRGVYASHNIRNDIKYCNCDRGKQLSSLIAQERRNAKIEVLEWVLLATRPENTEPIFDLLDELKEDKVRVTAADGEFNIASGELTLKEDKE